MLLTAITLAVALAPAVALAVLENVEGRPTDFGKGDEPGYAVFFVPEDGFHLQAMTGGARSHFKGTVKVVDETHWDKAGPGKIAGLSADAPGATWLSGHLKKQPRTLEFDFMADSKEVSGIHFRVEGAGLLQFLLCSGKGSSPHALACNSGVVKLGKGGDQPLTLPFLTAAHPGS